MNGINIVGTLTGTVGTVVAANIVVEALARAGVPMAGFDLVTDRHGRMALTPPPIPFVETIAELPYANTLFLDVVPAVHRALVENWDFFATQRRAMAFYYELTVIPLEWRPLLAYMDVLFAPSDFVVEAIRHSLGRDASYMPIVPLIDRAFAPKPLRHDRFRVHYSFDPLSAEDRKNPLAGLRAFSQAFAGRDDAELLLRVWNTDKLPCEVDRLDLHRDYHPNILISHDDLTYEQNLDTLARGDCYLSLHRGEGLGLAMLESMALGTNVIATDFGGSRDFIDPTTGIPVPYTLAEPATYHALFTPAMLGEPGYWAEADVAYGAAALRYLADDARRGRELALGARARYETRRAAFLGMEWLAPLLERRPMPTVTYESAASATSAETASLAETASPV